MSAKKEVISAAGYVLGHGIINNTVSVRRDGTYSQVGLVSEDDEWVEIIPYTEDEHMQLHGGPSPGLWLSELGPGKLVFIPDAPRISL